MKSFILTGVFLFLVGGILYFYKDDPAAIKAILIIYGSTFFCVAVTVKMAALYRNIVIDKAHILTPAVEIIKKLMKRKSK